MLLQWNHFCKRPLRCKCAHKHTALATDEAPPAHVQKGTEALGLVAL